MRRIGVISFVLLVLIATVVPSLLPVNAQTTFDRRLTWDSNSALSCPGEISCHQAGRGVLTSPDMTIPTDATHFDFRLLELTCRVENKGPHDAQFDLGVLFGPISTVLWPAGSGPQQAQGTYRGPAYDLTEMQSANPNWFINFRTGNTGVGGAPVLSKEWLIPTGNVFDGSGLVHLMIAVTSGSPSKFELFVSTCFLHVVFDAGAPTQTVQTTTAIGLTPLELLYAAAAIATIVGVVIAVLDHRSKRTRASNEQHIRKRRND